MSITYHLKFRNKLEQKPELTQLIHEYKNTVLLISNLYSTEYGYEGGKFQDEYLDVDLDNSSQISFDLLQKDADPQSWKKLLEEIIHKITNDVYPDEDYFFGFQGDIVYEIRENGIVKKNRIDKFI
ncbi:hypothetical protein [Chryseobacterium sp. BIGb0232]|uniref:hypothetical protein n=1 Tax=Chryseobacterium sp. BIGb0232 TaxID=2940598 RepID=UPI000F499B3A|nr:hypothetical protein [Chryseobacterium sp. BIGb0232]MCS4304505.1 hypothetical protein [Chryseobacterium sp. BIGb0232]ROS14359.1 hypothetical protein EDF65_3133 [Chryseobacterium nakagawai]